MCYVLLSTNVLVVGKTGKVLSFWNCYERLQEGRPRTTNDLEGFHRGFSILCRESHPPFYRLIPKLISVEVNAQKTVCERGHGSTQRKKATYINLSTKLKKIVANRDSQKILETLEKCANLRDRRR